MMYPYCKYADETEVVFSHIMKNEDGEEIIHVHTEVETLYFILFCRKQRTRKLVFLYV